jgi:putative addiction module killer protein
VDTYYFHTLLCLSGSGDLQKLGTPPGFAWPAVNQNRCLQLRGGGLDKMYPCGYTADVIEIRTTDVFNQWLDGLLDLRGRARIQARIERLAAGNAGDTKPVGEGISELRIDCGPGYRVYFKMHGRKSVILLAGGDKSTQGSDIKTASRLARNL